MATPYEAATLNLKLFEMRREPVLREARLWFVRQFTPQTPAELLALAGGPHNDWFRMVMGYWEMAASLVTSGAIDATSFLAAHSEVVVTYAKVWPFLSELRAASGEQNFLEHVEALMQQLPDAEATMTRRRTALLSAAERPRDAQSLSGNVVLE